MEDESPNQHNLGSSGSSPQSERGGGLMDLLRKRGLVTKVPRGEYRSEIPQGTFGAGEVEEAIKSGKLTDEESPSKISERIEQLSFAVLPVKSLKKTAKKKK
jgi:hypothetical protein